LGGRILLLGAGHAHLLLLAGAAALRGHQLTVVAPGPAWYSGLATGVLAGAHAPEDDQVDVAALASRCGARFVAGEAVALDRTARRVSLADGTALPYDALSLSLGSVVVLPSGAEAFPDRVFAAKPIARLAALRQELERRFVAGERVRVVVAGAGITGCEIAAAIAGLAARRGGSAAITLLAGDGRPLAALPDAVAARLLARLAPRGIAVRPGRVLAVEEDTLATTAGALPYDLLVVATGLRPPPAIAGFGLPVDAAGGLVVGPDLRSPADPRIHGAGDCIALAGHALPRAGVFAVRQAPVLRHNLAAAVAGGPTRRYRPQRRHLWIMNLGDGTGFARYGALHWQGRLALFWKDWLDRRFLARFARAR
jgi:NADH dehydrogenase FAD-containing subunit